MKVSELARELNIPPGKLTQFLFENGIRGKNAGSKLDPGTTTKITRLYKAKKHREENENQELEEKNISIRENSIKVSELPTLFDMPLPTIMKAFLMKGLLVNVNSEIDQETLIEVAKGLNITVSVEDTETEKAIGLKTKIMEIEEDSLSKNDKNQAERPPVIAIMGHVDHGKTLLLDSLRKSNVISSEAGGITQHIGAYQIKHEGKGLTFLDTPGHEAFTSLRARGAQVTDIAILVVAADDGIMPQTIEAIHHAKAADIPIIVAINKIDKPEADPDKVKQQLSQHDLVSEDWGGDVVMVPLSAKTGEGLPNLLEMLTLVSDMLELKASKEGDTKAVIIESELSSKKGALATVIVKAGTLSVGNYMVVDGFYGKVRAIFNDQGKQVKSLYPGDPGEILGLPQVPQPGSIIETRPNEKACKTYATQAKEELSALKKAGQKMSVSLDALSSQADEGSLRQLNLILKADVHGSLEAIKGSIEKIEIQDIPIKIIHSSTGSINENDVMLAKASEGVIFGFNSDASNEAKKLATTEKVTIKSYNIIYEILDDIQKVIQGLYKVEYVDIEKAQLEVRQLFSFSKVGTIAGCHVSSGKIDRNCMVRVIRNKEEVFEGKIKSLKRFEEDVKEVAQGFECGVVLEDFKDIREGDTLFAFKVEEVKPL